MQYPIPIPFGKICWSIYLDRSPKLIADVIASPVNFDSTYLMISSLIFSITVAIEAIVFKRLTWTWKNAFIDALWLNFVSIIFNYFSLQLFVLLLAIPLYWLSGLPEAIRAMLLSGCISIGLLATSLAIEVLLLPLVRGLEHKAKLRRSVIIANLCSHFILFIVFGVIIGLR